MSFVARLRPELIRVAPPWRTFEETIAGLVAVLAGERLLSAAAAPSAIQAVTAREAASSTALLDIHASVPHARLPGITQPVAALATSPHGLYEAVPTVPIQVVALLLSPRPATPARQTLRPWAALVRRAVETRRLRNEALTLRKVCRAGFCRPRHAVGPVHRAALSPSVPDPRQSLGSASISPRRRTRRAP